MEGVTFGSYHSFDSFHLLLNSKEIGAPEPKTIEVDIGGIDGVIVSHKEGHARGIASNHGDPEHLWNGLGLPYTMNTFRQAVKQAMNETVSSTGTQASSLKNMSESDIIAKVGALFTADEKKTGVLACVSFAQFILESGYGKSELAQNANNVFGMKKSL